MIRKQLINTLIILALSVALVFGISVLTKEEALVYTPGTYYGTATGNAEGLWVEVVLTEDRIQSVKVLEHHETAGIADPALDQIPVKIVAVNSPYVDAVSNATKTSEGIKNAVISCLYQSAGKEAIVSYEPEIKEDPVPLDYSYNPGVYSAEAEGYESMIKVEVEFSENAIVKVTILNSEDGEERVKAVKEGGLLDSILKWQTYEVDTVSGASWTSKGVMNAVKSCVEKAKK